MKREKSFVVCISNKGYAASLEVRKLYEALPDENCSSAIRFESQMNLERIISIQRSISFQCRCLGRPKRRYFAQGELFPR
jgi:hypothetical protein